jgi:negative regulator of replication initiation
MHGGRVKAEFQNFPLRPASNPQMKTLEISDELYQELAMAAARTGTPDVVTFLSGLAEVVRERKRGCRVEAERRCLAELDGKNGLRRWDLWQKFGVAMNGLLKVAPDRFEALEGLTHENGRVIFVSREYAKIKNSGASANPKKLCNSDWWVNATGGSKDFEDIIDKSCQIMGLTPGFEAELKARTINLPKHDPRLDDYA